MNLKGRSFLKLLDFTPEEILYLLDLAESPLLEAVQVYGIDPRDLL